LAKGKRPVNGREEKGRDRKKMLGVRSQHLFEMD
jgi:hypothetical protein